MSRDEGGSEPLSATAEAVMAAVRRSVDVVQEFLETSARQAAVIRSLDIELAIGTSNITLSVLNARLSFATNAAGNISVGQINGSIPHDNFMNTFPPAMAAMCNASIQSDPSSSTSTSCKSLFDKGCSGFPGYAGDGQIEVCEVTENALTQALLAPDVLVADGGSTVSANSIGIRFTAIAYDRVFASGFEP